MKGDIEFLTESAGELVTLSLKTLVREGPQLVWRRHIYYKPGAPITHPPIQSIGTDGAIRKQQPGTQRKLSPLSPSSLEWIPCILTSSHHQPPIQRLEGTCWTGRAWIMGVRPGFKGGWRTKYVAFEGGSSLVRHRFYHGIQMLSPKKLIKM